MKLSEDPQLFVSQSPMNKLKNTETVGNLELGNCVCISLRFGKNTSAQLSDSMTLRSLKLQHIVILQTYRRCLCW